MSARTASGAGGLEATLSGSTGLVDLYMLPPEDGFGAQAAVTPSANLERGRWIQLVFEVDQVNETVTLATSTG